MEACKGRFAVMGKVEGIMGDEARVRMANGTLVRAIVGLSQAPLVGQRYGGNVLLVGDAEWGANGRLHRFVVDSVGDDPIPVDVLNSDSTDA